MSVVWTGDWEVSNMVMKNVCLWYRLGGV